MRKRFIVISRKKEEGRRKKEEGRRKKEEGRRKREEGRGKKATDRYNGCKRFKGWKEEGTIHYSLVIL
ncbi:hypothetical protein NDI47_16030 [Microcoleus vaginatus GB1-A2]|uniref:hypothetical protein n=1 Tax=Microcoleus vaginatus TaxID=119532 RepID=UPI0016878AA4|nr:hypothetical protein [Microcoleus sp. FACHB-61]